MRKNEQGVPGQACTVAEGPNKGKKGTYTIDEYGNLWCEGEWGGTECRPASKCKDGGSKLDIRDFLDVDGRPVFEVEGFFGVEKVGIFQCNVKIDAATHKSKNVAAVRITSIPLSHLQKSSSKLERVIADAIRDHIDELTQPHKK